jgi:hypothetical protein
MAMRGCMGAMLKCSFDVAPWVPGAPTVMIANMPALDSTSMLMFNWAGGITISPPGQFTARVP